MTNRTPNRVAIVSDEDGVWRIRRIRTVEHDLDKDEKVYRCDQPIGTSFRSLEKASELAKTYLGISDGEDGKVTGERK